MEKKKKKNTGMEAKVVCLLGPDLLEAPGFGEFLDPECCVWAKQNKSLYGSHKKSDINALAYCTFNLEFGDSLKPSHIFKSIEKINYKYIIICC